MINKSLKMLLAAFLFSSVVALANDTELQLDLSGADICTEQQNECIDKCDSLDDESAKDECYDKCDIAYENCLAQQDK